ncbi:GNAT family N-acetyltransferase [Psychroserpens damuponensis]|uniref:GNAT family N-acetyltransferase n=1 Tax=Psychroserpens damuponensis TaxID=943936 RepID=UPI00058F95E2|nr:GNAT family N-acetyltransferase [Psychroserpens damuponensis]
MKFHLETKRLILRYITPLDVNGMFELDSNAHVHKYLGNNPITTKAQARDNITFINRQYKERGIARFAAIEKSSGQFIGWSGLKYNTGDKETIGTKRDFYDIGYRFIPEFWGKGYATESSIAILNYGFNNLNLPTIYGAAEIENIASNAVLKKIGLNHTEQFELEGKLINWYKLNKEDYAKTVS